ncbi:hypothetical protein B0T16DRAFT_420912 [Cercophora newfieldiana]|uniref:Uncharacterized protein n=1 Tax=Cercophora newfieldiana TaxID=92897 RepID=A0AA40CLP0_9PEZI|nr:hypothetical protein B0T16DRAFT_420912 [Cercophora newfieldiana]
MVQELGPSACSTAFDSLPGGGAVTGERPRGPWSAWPLVTCALKCPSSAFASGMQPSLVVVPHLFSMPGISGRISNDEMVSASVMMASPLRCGVADQTHVLAHDISGGSHRRSARAPLSDHQGTTVCESLSVVKPTRSPVIIAHCAAAHRALNAGRSMLAGCLANL